jgi:hypothetical protein
MARMPVKIRRRAGSSSVLLGVQSEILHTDAAGLRLRRENVAVIGDFGLASNV